MSSVMSLAPPMTPPNNKPPAHQRSFGSASSFFVLVRRPSTRTAAPTRRPVFFMRAPRSLRLPATAAARRSRIPPPLLSSGRCACPWHRPSGHPQSRVRFHMVTGPPWLLSGASKNLSSGGLSARNLCVVAPRRKRVTRSRQSEDARARARAAHRSMASACGCVVRRSTIESTPRSFFVFMPMTGCGRGRAR